MSWYYSFYSLKTSKMLRIVLNLLFKVLIIIINQMPDSTKHSESNFSPRITGKELDTCLTVQVFKMEL